MRRPAELVLLLLLLSVASPLVAAHEDTEEVEAKIAELAAAIRTQEGRRTDIQAEITSSEERMRQLRARLADAATRLQALQDRVTETERTYQRLRESVELLERQIAELRIELRATRSVLRSRAVELYVRGSTEMQALLYDVSAMEELAVGLSYAKEVVVETETLVRALEVLRANEEATEQELKVQKDAAARTLEDLKEQREEAAAEKAAVEEAHAEVEAEVAAQQQVLVRVEQLIEEYESEKELAESELAELERQIRERASEEAAAPGRLRWPISAAVTSTFGLRIHPILGTVRLHAGIDLRAGTGTPIGAAGPGTVILAAPWGGYGNTVVIDHGGGLSTLYAHQSSLAVRVGDTVSAGEVIGYVGSTGYSTGPHLHFETRENGIPVDPMKYLG